MPTSTLTRRQRIVNEIERRIGEIVQGSPAADPYLLQFDVITRGSKLEALHRAGDSGFGISIIDTDESKTVKFQQKQCNLTVVFEFLGYIADGEKASDVGNRILGTIQRKMAEDIHLTEPDDGRTLVERQLTEEIDEVRNQLFIDGYADLTVTGAIFFNIKYKHAIVDPRELAGL